MTTEPSKHWATVQETSTLWGIRILVWVYRLLGRGVFRLFLYPVIGYYFATGKLARNASLDYLQRLSGFFPQLGLVSGYRLSFRHFLNFGETLLDKIVVWTGGIDPTLVDFPNRPLLLEMLEQHRGGLIISGHIGNLEICQAIANMRGMIRLNILVHTKHAEKFNRLLGNYGGTANLTLIQVTEIDPSIAIDLQDKIERGEFVVMVGDRIPVNGGRTISIPFLGTEADFPQGPYLLASLLRCPVYTLFCYPYAGRYLIDLQPFAESIRIPRAEPERRQTMQQLARRYAERLEVLCQKVPLQWFNFYHYWQQLPPNGKTDS